VRRGEIWYARLDPPRRSKPVLLLTRDGVYDVRTHVSVAMVTRSARGLPFEVPVGPGDGLRYESAVNLDDINTIPKASLDRRITMLSPAKMADVAAAISYALELA
jgi:mRNA-degrading endonuclease toxin of MazEF toxin-antitoxin module